VIGLRASAVLGLAVMGCAPSLGQKGSVMPTRSTDEHEAIRTTVVGVAHSIDHKAWRELRELYADVVRTDYTSLFGGEVQEQPGDALIGAWQKLLTPIVTQHQLGPIAVDMNGSSAVARCHVRGYHYAKGAAGGDEWMVAGHYVFELAKNGGRWTIHAMTLETFYQTGNTKLLEVAGGK
jgi:hypothetical protein